MFNRFLAVSALVAVVVLPVSSRYAGLVQLKLSAPGLETELTVDGRSPEENVEERSSSRTAR